MSPTIVKVEEFKDSPLGMIPKDWKVQTISELADTYAGGTPSRHFNSMFGGSIPWVKSSELNSSEINDTEEKLTEFGHRSSSTKWIPANTTLVAMYGATAGLVSWLKIKAVTNQAVLAILPKSNETFSRWLYWNFNLYSAKLISSVQGSGQPNLNKKIIDELKICQPPFEEQKRIVEILDTVDESIAHTESLIQKLKQMKAGLLHDLLTRGLDENGELRDAIVHPEQFKDSPMGRIPKEWELTTIGEQAFTGSGSTPNRGIISYWQNGTIGWIKTGEINYNIILNTEEKITEKALAETSLKVYPAETVLIAMYGEGVTRGKAAILGIESTINQACAAIISKTSNLIQRYLFHYLSNQYKNIRNLSHGSHQSNLNEALIASFPMLLPSKDEQNKIIKIIDDYNNRIHQEEAYRDKLKQQKKGLMQDLLTGKVRVKSL